MNRPTREEAGSALVETIWLGLLLMLPLCFGLASVLQAQRGSFAAATAARSAARAFVTAPDQASARARAETAVAWSLADQGIEGERFDVRIHCHPDPAQCLQPGGTVQVEVVGSVRLPLVPNLFGLGVPAIEVSARQESPYGEYREARP